MVEEEEEDFVSKSLTGGSGVRSVKNWIFLELCSVC